MSSSLLQVRIPQDEKQEFFAIIRAHDITPSQFLRMIVRRTNQTKKLPFSFDEEWTPNTNTISYLSQSKEKMGIKRLEDVDDILTW